MFVKLEIVEIDGAPGIILPREALEYIQAGADDELDVTYEPGCVVLKRCKPTELENDNVLS